MSSPIGLLFAGEQAVNVNWFWGCAFALIALCGVSQSVNAQGCPAGMNPTGDGYCLSANAAYCGGGMACSNGTSCLPGGRCFYQSGCFPDRKKNPGSGTCIPSDYVFCAHGNSCPAGEQCTADGCQ